MKTERRHELQKNDLADWLGKHIERVRPYSKAILAVALLVAAGAVAGTYIRQDQVAKSQQSWNEFYRAFAQQSPEALNEVAERYTGTEAALWARQAAGDMHLSEGIGDLYFDRDAAKDSLQQARQAYEVVEALASDDVLKQRAWFGLAQVHESLSELDDARNYYGRLTDSFPDSALGREAERRLDSLQDQETEKWYNWFANQKPQPRVPSSSGLPAGMEMPNLPAELGGLSDRPDISVPGGNVIPSAAEPDLPPTDEASEADDADSTATPQEKQPASTSEKTEPEDETAGEAAPSPDDSPNDDASNTDEDDNPAASDSEDAEGSSETPPQPPGKSDDS